MTIRTHRLGPRTTLAAAIAAQSVILALVARPAAASPTALFPTLQGTSKPAQSAPAPASTTTPAPAAGSAKTGSGNVNLSANNKAAIEKARVSAEHIHKANALVKQGNYEGAKQELIAADKLTPDYCPVLQQLSNIQLRLGETDAALASLERAIRKGKGFDDHTYLLAARIFSQKKAFLDGQRKIVEWAGNRPVSANFHAAIGLLKLGALEFGPAEIELREALKMDPGNEAALTAMTQLYGRVGAGEKLQPILDRGLAAKPDSVPILMLSGNNLLQLERYADAKQKFDTLIKIDPLNVAAYVNLGSCLHGMGDTAGAIQNFRKATEMDPKSVEAPINLALALEREHKAAEARDVLLKARANNPQNLDFLNALAMAYHLNGQLDEAIATMKDSLARDPDQPQMKKLLSQVEEEKRTGKPASP